MIDAMLFIHQSSKNTGAMFSSLISFMQVVSYSSS